jgi:hypothetical protein
MVVLAYLGSQRTKFHGRVDVLTYVRLFGVMYLALHNFAMDPKKEQQVCIKFCANLGKSAIGQAFEEESMSCTRVFNGMLGSRLVRHPLRTTNTQVSPSAAQRPTLLPNFNSSFVRINIKPFKTLLMRSELVMGHANRF